MGQKVHPLGFRLGITQKHQSYWCTRSRESRIWIQDARFLREYINIKYPKSGITNIEIRRQKFGSSALSITIYSSRPNAFHTPENVNLDALRENLILQLQRWYRKRRLELPEELHVRVYVKPVQNPEKSAHVLAERLVEELEQRKPYRRAMRQIVQKALRAGVKGIRVQISGRLNGADIARSEDIREGPVPLQTLRADIEYTSQSAKTMYGLLGIKIWVFHGEKLTPVDNLPEEGIQSSTEINRNIPIAVS